MSDYIKLAEAPLFAIQMPQCSACGVDLEWDDGFTCPVCGTAWPSDASDGDAGDLYESWSGETLDGPALDESDAWEAGYRYEREQREATLASLGIGRPS